MCRCFIRLKALNIWVIVLSFDAPSLPVSRAHAITADVSNLWLNYRSIVTFVPIRPKILHNISNNRNNINSIIAFKFDLASGSTETFEPFETLLNHTWQICMCDVCWLWISSTETSVVFHGYWNVFVCVCLYAYDMPLTKHWLIFPIKMVMWLYYHMKMSK